MVENENEAYWIEKKVAGGDFWDYYFVCSVCNHKTPVRGYTVAPDFCPGCGRYMVSKHYVYSFDGKKYKKDESLNAVRTDEELERAANSLMFRNNKFEIKIGVECNADLNKILDFELGNKVIKDIQDNAEKLYDTNAKDYLTYVTYDDILDLDNMLKASVLAWVNKKVYLRPTFKHVKLHREYTRNETT